jgi:hypothetical protein
MGEERCEAELIGFAGREQSRNYRIVYSEHEGRSSANGD